MGGGGGGALTRTKLWGGGGRPAREECLPVYSFLTPNHRGERPLTGRGEGWGHGSLIYMYGEKGSFCGCVEYITRNVCACKQYANKEILMQRRKAVETPTKNFANSVPPILPLLTGTVPSLLKQSDTRSSSSGFFHESVSPEPLSIPIEPIQIFKKIRGDIRNFVFIRFRSHWR